MSEISTTAAFRAVVGRPTAFGSCRIDQIMDETDNARIIIDKIMSALIYFVSTLTNF
jgi:hypothetical protein